MSNQSQYAQLGIDAHKRSVKKSFSDVIDNDFPMAFCNIIRDSLNPGYVITQHMDGDGSKIVQRLLHYKETGDPTIFRGAVDDALSMNTGDAAASGFVSEYIFNDVINIYGKYAPKELIMNEFAIRFAELKQLYRDHGISVFFLGGETADLPDQLRTVVFDVCVNSRTLESQLIFGHVLPGDVIYGMASDGRAKWETKDNSGLMSNGLTMGRIKLMHPLYGDKYPELIRDDKRYEGSYRFNDQHILLNNSMTIGEAILSPTRHWALVIKQLISVLTEGDSLHLLHGIVMNTGGGATKACNIGKNICYEKTMPEPPPIFRIIQEESGEEWCNMYTTFNCGVGIDIIGSSENGILQKSMEEVTRLTGVEHFLLGGCTYLEKHQNEVKLKTPFGEFLY